MTLAATIGKVTCKRTGREIRVITPSFKSGDEVKKILQQAMEVARNQKVTSVAYVLVGEDDGYITDFCGMYEECQAGSSFLDHRIGRAWDEYSKET